MSKSFYHYFLKYRDQKNKDDLSQFANDMYDDHSFPKYTGDYNELSNYLELNGHYLNSMTVFDKAWEMYKNEK
ncbi:YozE family protein [Bacillus timonensis]|nr:YozE family protein [Bacillus timonensis]